MAVTTTNTNKPINPRGDDKSPLAFNRAKIYSGKALDFDGVNDKVDLPTLSFDLYAFSFYYEGAITTGSGQFVFHTGGGTNDGISIGSVTSLVSGETLMIGDGGNYTAVIESFADAIHFIVCTWNATENKYNFYLNAQKLNTINSGTDAPLISLSTAPAIGYRKAIGDMYLNGKISNVRAFSTALTAAQVLELYNNPEKIVPTGVDNTALKLWLPMMEGAGTTAYDGSGNGNHGTISGATWTHGVGAPVAQSAVIDWNKGSNFYNDSDWEVSNATTDAFIFSSSQSAPNGINTAAVFDDGTGSTYKRVYKVSNTAMAIGQITASTFVKKKDVDYINLVLGTDGGTYKFFALVDLVYGTINATSGSLTATSIQSVGDGWYYVSVEASHLSTTQGITYIYGQDPTNGSSVDENYTGANNQTYIWGINIQQGSINNVHLPTIGALQSSPVLLPQGLTSGRDITGVNLFENVRKQYALNLDGQSWAEVHDNESLDMGTGSFTLEAWVRVNYLNQGSAFNVILGLGGNASDAGRSFIYYNGTFDIAAFAYNNNASASLAQTIGTWIHIVGTYDETNATLYINGAQVDQDARTAADITNDLVKMIGRDSTTARYYNDQIAQPRIYNRALTADEVEQNYNAGKNTYS